MGWQRCGSRTLFNNRDDFYDVKPASLLLLVLQRHFVCLGARGGVRGGSVFTCYLHYLLGGLSVCLGPACLLLEGGLPELQVVGKAATTIKINN